MIKQGRKKGTVRFVYTAENGATDVSVAGDFTAWEPVGMKKQRGGTYAVTLEVPPGSHEYRLVVDGLWMADPDHHNRAPNPFGSVNSVVEVT
ncbi:MAG: isoamylase early set domain-containing protein [Planctomycetes bacterium]|nr:isoamylase early set domain-containing protein [Planctomycetota bacterium]